MKFHIIRTWIIFCSICYVFLLSVPIQAETQKGEKEKTVSSGKTVSIEYTLKLEDQKVIDSNVGAEPMIYLQGAQQIIPGLEKALDGMKIGESKQVTIKPEEGYGPVNKDAFKEVNKEEIPQKALKVGTRIQGQDENGQLVHARIAEIKEKTVVIDLNHMLAGKTLYFDVKVLDINDTAVK